MIQSKIVEAKIVDDAAVIEAKIGKLTEQESLAVLALCGKFDRLMELQEEYYRRHPLRRLLRNLRLLPDPYVPARLWALELIYDPPMNEHNRWTLLHKLKVVVPKSAILTVISKNLIPDRRYRILCDSVIISEFGGVHEKEDIFVESTGEMQIFDLLTNGSDDQGEGDHFYVKPHPIPSLSHPE